MPRHTTKQLSSQALVGGVEELSCPMCGLTSPDLVALYRHFNKRNCHFLTSSDNHAVVSDNSSSKRARLDGLIVGDDIVNDSAHHNNYFGQDSPQHYNDDDYYNVGGDSGHNNCNNNIDGGGDDDDGDDGGDDDDGGDGDDDSEEDEDDNNEEDKGHDVADDNEQKIIEDTNPQYPGAQWISHDEINGTLHDTKFLRRQEDYLFDLFGNDILNVNSLTSLKEQLKSNYPNADKFRRKMVLGLLSKFSSECRLSRAQGNVLLNIIHQARAYPIAKLPKSWKTIDRYRNTLIHNQTYLETSVPFPPYFKMQEYKYGICLKKLRLDL
jgi:hypothetical protein